MTSRRRAPLKVEVVLADALVLKPNEVLILKVNADLDNEQMEDFNAALRSVGLGTRTLVIAGDVELGKAERE